jgi:hypothetical protein
MVYVLLWSMGIKTFQRNVDEADQGFVDAVYRGFYALHDGIEEPKRGPGKEHAQG